VRLVRAPGGDVTDLPDGIVHEFELPFRALDIVAGYGRNCGDRSDWLNTICAWLAFTTADLWDDVSGDDQMDWLDRHQDCCADALRDVLARVADECRKSSEDE
jgi:hypothetical protein